MHKDTSACFHATSPVDLKLWAFFHITKHLPHISNIMSWPSKTYPWSKKVKKLFRISGSTNIVQYCWQLWPINWQHNIKAQTLWLCTDLPITCTKFVDSMMLSAVSNAAFPVEQTQIVSPRNSKHNTSLLYNTYLLLILTLICLHSRLGLKTLCRNSRREFKEVGWREKRQHRLGNIEEKGTKEYHSIYVPLCVQHLWNREHFQLEYQY
jgi:hypothetical protein